jgi:cysteine desulfurase
LIYLDHNAATPLAPETLDVMLPYLREEYGNPSSDHPLGHRAHRAVSESRELIASVIDANPSEVVVTSGGTESNNLVIRGTAASAPAERRSIVTAQVEHSATRAPWDLLERLGWTITRLPVTDAGSVDVETAIEALDDDVARLTVMLAQNETGAVMPIAEVALAARHPGIVVHTDVAQALGKIEVSVENLVVDLLSITDHKLYGPKDVGALYVRSGTPLQPAVTGGFRSGDSVLAPKALPASWAWDAHATWQARAWGPSRAPGETFVNRCGGHCPSRSQE